MPLDEIVADGKRQMKICNACRYCEGYCAVWHAIEWRRDFTDRDMFYLANLCHDCRDCYFACPFTAPHEFGVNPPKLFAGLREEAYRKYAWPGTLTRILGATAGFWITATVALILLALGVATANGWRDLVELHAGTGAFYGVLSETVLEITFGALGLWFIGGWCVGAVRFWRDIRGSGADKVQFCDVRVASAYAAKLRYLGRGAQEEELAGHRKWLHHFVFYGFLFDFASTLLAAVYSHLLHIQAPYPVVSPVVILGVLGGIGIIIGAAGLLFVKSNSNSAAADKRGKQSGSAFSVSLLMVAGTGMFVLLLRHTSLMGVVLVIHLASVASLFLTAPYTKFVHSVYRYLALIRYAQEERVAAERSRR